MGNELETGSQDFTDEEEKTPDEAPIGDLTVTDNQGGTVGPTGSIGTQTAATSGKGSAAGARFQNLKKYIDKNQNAGLAQKITQGVQKQETGLGKEIGQSQSQFESNLAAEKQRLSGGEQLLGVEPTGEANVDKANDFFKNQATQYAQDAGNVEKFQGYRGDEAKFQREDEKSFQQKQDELKAKAERTKTEGGRFSLLKDTFGQGRQYGTGASRLDQMLLQSQVPEIQKMQQLGQTASIDTGQALTDLRTGRDVGQSDVSRRAEALRGQIKSGLADENTAMKSDIDQRVADYNQARIAGETTGRTYLEDQAIEDYLQSTGAFDKYRQIGSFGMSSDRFNAANYLQQLASGGGINNYSFMAPDTTSELAQMGYENVDNREAITNKLSDILRGQGYDYRNYMNTPEIGTSGSLSTESDLLKAQALADLGGTGEQTLISDVENIGKYKEGLPSNLDLAKLNTDIADMFSSRAEGLDPSANMASQMMLGTEEDRLNELYKAYAERNK